MKHSGLSRAIVAIAMMLIGWLPSLAHGFKVDGIFYDKLNSSEVAVTYNSSSNEYSGDVVIPSSVDYNGITYSVTSIGDQAFYGCTNLTSVKIPNSVTSIGDVAFRGCSSLTSIVVDAGNTKYDSRNGCNAIIETASNTLIAGCQNTIIPNSVTSIGDWAFSETGLTSVEIPNSVSQIGIAAFSFNNNLSHISVESGNPVYDSRENCNAIIETSSNKLIAGCKNSKILNSITTIGDRSFAGCNGITFIAIPNTVTNIELGAFGYCENLTNIEIPNSVIEIGESVFESCKSLTTIEIPNSVTEIKYRLFYRCRNLTNVVIPNSVNTIGRFAFAECYSLTSIEIPNLVTSIDSSVFELCNNLTNIVVGNGNPKYDSRNGCNAIIETASNTLIIGCQNTIIPNDVASIGNHAFRCRDGLTSIEIPNSVTSIGNSAFSDCKSLTSIQIGNSVTDIGEDAFAYCSNLFKITCLATTPPVIGSNTFTYYNADLYVPAGCKEAYEAADFWKNFTNIIELEPELEEGATFEYEGLTYKVIVKGEELAVIASENGKYSGDIVVPSSVDYNGTTYSVTSIGGGAFHSCSSLTSVVIGNSVTSIGEYAFYYCSSLTSVVIGNSVTSIGDCAFAICYSLTSIEIPNSVTSIGNNAFNSSGLSSIEIPNSVTSIGDDAFNGCSSLTSIEIPNSVTSIGDGAFCWCTGLTSIVVDSGNTKYDSRNGCNAIIETASNTLIAGCQNTIIPNSVTIIGNWAFYGCDSLTSVEIGNSVTSIGGGAFQYCSSLTEITCHATTPPMIKSDSFSNYSADLYVPAGCKEAYEAAEYWNKFTNIIELEPELEEGATFEYEGLTYKVVVKGEELAVIASENGKYSGDIVIPSSVDYNGITYSVTSIGEDAFYYCSRLTSIEIPNSITSIGKYAFSGCSRLTSIEIPNSVTSIGDGAFYWCSKLSSIEIPNSVTSIGEDAFKLCSSLTSIEIPNSVTSIGDDAFYGCSSLTNIEIPNSVTSIGLNAFGWCKGLTSIVVDAGNSIYDSRNGCNAIIETTSNTLIAGCQNSKIPNSVTSIGSFAFFGCDSLTSIEIPNSVTSIGYEAFQSCSSLTEITCHATTPPMIKSDSFSNYSVDLFVPAGCKEAYEAAEYWNKFTNIIEIEEPNVNLFIDDFAINAGETKELVINLTNEIAFTGFQADLYLPDGLEIEQEEGDYIFELTDRKGNDHVLTSGKQANGAIRILCFSTKLNEFSGSEGAVVKFRVTAANDFVGNYEIGIKDIILAQSDESEYQLPATTTKVEARMLAKSITLDQTEVSLEATQTTTLLATILPDNTSVKTVVWTSSDEDVAVVDENGVVTAIAIGEATITATTTDGTNLSASCKVTVVPTLGDANNDAVISVTDIMVVASYILGNTPEGFVFEAADVTKDGKINIIDIVAIANIILSSETPDETQFAARVARKTALGSRLFIDDTSIQEGETMQLAVNLTNDIAFSGFQADIKLPEGLELCQEDGEYMISLSDRKGSDHVLTSAMLPDGTIRILSYSMNLNDFAGADGALVYLTVKATQHFVGDYEISINNITFTQADLTEYSLEPTVCRIAGTVGIEGIEAEQEAEYFNLQGLPVANPEKGGFYIIKRGDKVSKSIIK